MSNYSNTYLESFQQARKQFRVDRKARCKAGKPCGDVCIPRDAECKLEIPKSKTRSQAAKKAVENQRKNFVNPYLATAGIALGTVAGLTAFQAVKNIENQKQEDKATREWQRSRKERERDFEEFKKRVGERFNEKTSQGFDFNEETFEEWAKKAQQTQEEAKKAREFLDSLLKGKTKTSSGKDYWEVLNISKNATPDEIKRAYKDKIRLAHPDVGGTTKEAQEVNEAYEVAEAHTEWKKKRKKTDSVIMLNKQQEVLEAYFIAQQKFPEIDKAYWNNLEISLNNFTVSQSWKLPLLN